MYPLLAIDTYVKLFVQDRLIAYLPAPIDTNGKLFVCDPRDIGFPALIFSMSMLSSHHW